MGSQKIDIRKLAPIGISNIDVYNNGEKLSGNDIPKNATKVKLRIGVFFDGTLNNGFNSEAVYIVSRNVKQKMPNIYVWHF